MLQTVLFIALLVQAPAGMTAAPPSGVEGRPAVGQASPLQALVDAAAPGGTVVVDAGRYDGDLVIDRPLHLVGRGRPLLIGSGAGSVVRVRADGVTIEGFDIDAREGGSVANDSSGIHVAATRVVIRDCHIVRALFGIYLREADEAVIERVTIAGIHGKPPGEQGSGIHLWNTHGFTLRDNQIRDTRDGFYLQNSSHGLVARNVVTDVRYGLHYMFSDNNVFEDNTFERSAAGAAIMFSKHLEFRRNRFLHNRGFASVGLLLQSCDEVVAEDNLIADNARGVFLEGARHHTFRRNLIAESDIAIVLYDSSRENRFEGNGFVGNLSPLQLVGRRTDTVFAGNYWSDDADPDLDGDGVRDQPYRLSNVFDHFRGNLTAADLFAQGLAADVLARAELLFPVLAPIAVVDPRPLARLPKLARLPAPSADAARGAPWGLTVSAIGFGGGLTVLLSGRRRAFRIARPR